MRRRRQPIQERDTGKSGEGDDNDKLRKETKEQEAESYTVEDGRANLCSWIGILLLLSSGGVIVYHVLMPYAVQMLDDLDIVLYRIPQSLSRVGDKSLGYQLLRLYYALPHDDQRSLQAVEDLQWRRYQATPNPDYNVYECPHDPPEHYPYTWNAADVVSNWPIEDLVQPDSIHHSLCVFDAKKEKEKVMRYRKLELPFVVRGDPSVARTVERWHKFPNYLERLMGDTPHRTEVANQSRYVYWAHPELSKRRAARSPRSLGINYDPPQGWEPPTEMMKLSYQEWLQVANGTSQQKEHEFYYFQTVGCGDVPKCEEGATEFLFDELTFFQPRDDSLYLVEPDKQKGIHCRFGMPGLWIAAHFDGSRNSIVILQGSRRYIMAHPRECPNLGLYRMGHPSSRHSGLNWTSSEKEHTEWRTAQVTEFILQAGDVLYLPTHWFHMIVSLDVNIQCNTRSGIDKRHTQLIKDCGFHQEF